MPAWCVVLMVCMTGPLCAYEWGREPIPETGESCRELGSFDQMMRDFLRDNQLPGGALAVARHGAVIYARGFGYADVEQCEPVQPESLFRIASLSKPITAVAILQLVDAGRLRLDDHVLDLLPQRPYPPDAEVDARWQRITIRQLLQHRGGWDRSESFDPMFRSVEIARTLGAPPPAKPDQIVSYMLARQLDFEPGERYAYSNFGYCLLGRVIEQVTHSDYESWVRQQVLEPMGIRRMRLGATLPSQRLEGEVKYYAPGARMGRAVVGPELGSRVPQPYGTWYLEAMDAHGGWLASALDLVQFAARVQDWQHTKVLSPDMYQALIACPPGRAGHDAQGQEKSSYYGLGWDIRRVSGGYNLWHMGALSGTSTLLVLRHDGLCWAVLFNSSSASDRSRPAAKIDALVHQAAAAVERWPQ